MARIAIGGFQHETNSFAPTLATYEEFERGSGWPPLTRGETLPEAVRHNNIPIAGFVNEAPALGFELLPTVWSSTSPSGPVTKDAYERITQMLLDDLAEHLPVDAVYLDLHGAMVAEHLEDGEGELLRRVRDVVGTELPVVASLDYHGNVTAEMVRHATALIGYETYPHVDMADTGRRAARYLHRLLQGGPMPHKAFRQLPFLIPVPWGCTLTEPAMGTMRRRAELETGGVDTLSFFAGFPAADIRDCGASVIGYGADSQAVEAAVRRLAELAERHESDWGGRLWDPEEAVIEANRLAAGASRPVVLADIQDNPGAGGSSDTMGLLKAMVRLHAQDAAIGLIYDPHVATIAHRCGEGAEINVCLGGKHGSADGSLDATFMVDRLGDGKFECTGPFYGPGHMELAPMACIRIGGVRIAVAGKRVQAADQAMFRHLGIEPMTEKILALKSSVHFRADFQPIAEQILLVRAPGAAIADPAELPFTRLRPGLRLRPGGPAMPS